MLPSISHDYPVVSIHSNAAATCKVTLPKPHYTFAFVRPYMHLIFATYDYVIIVEYRNTSRFAHSLVNLKAKFVIFQ